MVMIINNKNENLQKKYIRMSYNPHSMDENVEFYSAYKTINKNIQKQLRNKGYNRNNNINSNKDRNIEIRIDLDNFNSNSKSKEIYLDKKDFMKNIKEINDLDYIDNVPEEDNNNIYNENKNIYLNKKNYKNQKSINNTSEKKEIKNYNRIINRNNNLVIPQKETKTDKKKLKQITYANKIQEKC